MEELKLPVPLLSIVVVMVLQTLAGVWWASSINTQMAFLQSGQVKVEAAITASNTGRYTAIDAARDFSSVDRRISSIEADIQENKKAVVDLQILIGGKKNQ